MDTNSGIILPQEAHVSEQFTDITPIPCKGYNLLCKAKHYGRWWMLKGLKPEFREQEIYRSLLRKEFEILISLQHPNIVSASSLEEMPGLGACIVMEWIEGRTLDDFINELSKEDSIEQRSEEGSFKKHSKEKDTASEGTLQLHHREICEAHVARNTKRKRADLSTKPSEVARCLHRAPRHHLYLIT